MARSIAIAAAALAGVVHAAKPEASPGRLAITMAVPPSGSAGPITGAVTGATGLNHNQYKVSVLTSGDGGQTWWDKSHGPYRNKQLADPGYDAGDAQNAGVVLQADFTWKLANYQASPNDATSDLWIAFCVPQSYDMSYPAYQIEGVAIRADLQAASLTWVLVSKTRGTLGSGAGAFPGVGSAANGGSAAPAASTAAAPAASPNAAAPSTAAEPAASPNAAAPSTAALPAGGGSAPAANGTVVNGTVTSGATGFQSLIGAAVAAVAAAYVLA